MSHKQAIYCCVYINNCKYHLTVEQWQRFYIRSLDFVVEFEETKIRKHYKNGDLHRTDGPAIEGLNIENFWFVNGKQLSKTQVEDWIQENSIDLSTEEGQAAFKLRWL